MVICAGAASRNIRLLRNVSGDEGDPVGVPAVKSDSVPPSVGIGGGTGNMTVPR